MRKLASVVKVLEVSPIKNADNIEVATVKGWKVVVKKGEFVPGDFAVYFEIDSWIPHALAPFLSSDKVREYEGVPGNRLRTVKLRGQISQGLLLTGAHLGIDLEKLGVDADLTEILNIKKYEPPVPAQLAGLVKSNFPSFLVKTDEERIQNLDFDQLKLDDGKYYVTEKLDGSSMTVYLYEELFGVCSRNLDLKETEDNTLWKVARELKIEENLRYLDISNIAIQGELIGPGIQSNPYKLSKHEFRPFTAYDIDAKSKLSLWKLMNLCAQLGLKMVPVLRTNYGLPSDLQSALKFAEGTTSLPNSNATREGVVVRTCDCTKSFKIISNKFLLKSN